MAEPARAKPKPTPETQHFWDGTQAGELRLQRCDACANVYFPPRPFCPSCASRKVSVFKASGKGHKALQLRHQPPARCGSASRRPIRSRSSNSPKARG